MKKSLGKIIFLLLLSVSMLEAAKLASYTLQANKTKVYEKEAIEITFTANQLDHTDEMFFFLEPKKSDNYEIQFLTQENKKISRHNTISIFRYLLFPLKSGNIPVNFDFTVKTASDDAVAQIYTGGRNNVKWIETVDTKIKVKPLLLNVKPLQENVDIVGDFTLEAKLQNDHIDKYGSANIRYFLSGTGYVSKDIHLLQNIEGVTLFNETKDSFFQNTAKGYELRREFAYALVSEHDFQIPSLALKAFSPKENRYYVLQTKPFHVRVSAIEPKTLLDTKESPKEEEIDLSVFKNILWTVLIFFAGFISAKLLPSFKLKKIKKRFEDIRSAKTPKELILVLLQNYSHKKIQEFIDELEAIEYKNSTKDFKEIKQEILKKFM